MWNNSLWEQEHQEELEKDYLYKLINAKEWIFERPVRRIICEGCGNVFYTQVKVKKYCNENCAKKGFWKHKRQRSLKKRKDMVCKTCGKTFTPKRSDAKYCSNGCRQKAYRQSVTDSGNSSKRSPTTICNKEKQVLYLSVAVHFEPLPTAATKIYDKSLRLPPKDHSEVMGRAVTQGACDQKNHIQHP